MDANPEHVRELVLYARNSSGLYERFRDAAKFFSIYGRAIATFSATYSAARKYQREFGGSMENIFSPADILAAASELVAYYEQQAKESAE